MAKDKINILEFIETTAVMKRKEDGSLNEDTLPALKTLNPSIGSIDLVMSTVIRFIG